ncbi:MAG: hypothetical protein A2Y33_14020 [Spirochaetes bacterium GWF1_51_8]|nr:MAG: hypothetical protein A2Y33_14020 [Spirochaetes bacterium GWF1_51_8]
MKKHHEVANLEFRDSHLMIEIDGESYEIDLSKQSKKLAESPDEIKNNYTVSPSGYGIHWPEIDEDLSIDGLLKSATKCIKISSLNK